MSCASPRIASRRAWIAEAVEAESRQRPNRRSMRTWAASALWSVLACGVLVGVAASPARALPARPKVCSRQCKAKDFSCRRAIVDCLIDAGRVRPAVGLAKQWIRNGHDGPEYLRLLARAYLAADNSYWALRVLVPLARKRPGDCLTRSMIAWVHLRDAQLDLAEQALGQQRRCPNKSPDRARWALLRALIADLRGDRWRARSLLSAVESARTVYPEDRSLWRHLLLRVWPERRAPIQLNADVSLGYTANATGMIPIASVPANTSSAILGGGLSGRIVGPSAWAVRPLLEAGISMGLAEDFGDVPVHHVSQLFTSFRPGLTMDLGAITGLLGYRNTLFALGAPNPITGAVPTVGIETHRGELELVLPHGITVLGGVGRQYVFQVSRTGWMFDGGGGWSVGLAGGHNLSFAASGRYYPADVGLYTQYGFTVAANWGFPIHGRFTGQLRLSEAFDYYPNSPATGGNYSLLGGALDIWASVWGTAQAGVGYDFNWGEGNTGAFIPFSAHRIVAKLRWNLSWDPWAPKPHRPKGHVAIDYGLKRGTDFGRDVRIQDLLRVDSIPQQSAVSGK